MQSEITEELVRAALGEIGEAPVMPGSTSGNARRQQALRIIAARGWPRDYDALVLHHLKAIVANEPRSHQKLTPEQRKESKRKTKTRMRQRCIDLGVKRLY